MTRSPPSPAPRPPIPREDTVGLIVAGGEGRRFGADKLRAPAPSGETLLVRAWRALAPRCALVVALARNDAALRAAGLPAEVPIWLDPQPSSLPDGPLQALAHGLARAEREGFATALVLAPDLVRVGPDEIDAVRLALVGAVPAAVGEGPHGMQPLCGAYRTCTATALLALVAAGERRLVRAVGQIGAIRVPIAADRLVNVNTQDDLRHLSETP
jgi:molybdopterin-guanine dinucleotide biosynthesis protein A